MAHSAILYRSELVAVEVSDIAFDADGSGTVTVGFSKTDEAAEGHVRYLAPFAVVALTAWLDAADIAVGVSVPASVAYRGVGLLSRSGAVALAGVWGVGRWVG